MKKQRLDQSVRDHLNDQSLTPGQLDRLMELQNHANADAPKPDQTPMLGRIAAVLVLVVASLATFLYLNPALEADPALRIAEEVATNHLQNRPLEIEGSEISELRDYFTELDFVLRDSVRVAGELQVMGGRYCSIQGVGAAQLRVHKAQRPFGTLYQVPYDADRHASLPRIDIPVTASTSPHTLVRYARGVRVEMWVEKGLLFALAGD